MSEIIGRVLDERFITKLSIAVSLIDGFIGRREVRGKVEVSILDEKLIAIKNPSGYFNFLDIPDDTYSFEITSEYYLKEKIENFVLPRNTNYNLTAAGAPAGSTSTKLTSITGLRDGDVIEFDNGADQPERRIVYIDSNPGTKKIHWDKNNQGVLVNNYPAASSVSIPFPYNFVLPVTLIPNHLYSFPSGTTLVRGSLINGSDKGIDDAKVEAIGKKIKTKTSINGEFILFFPASQTDESIQIKTTSLGKPPKTVTRDVKKGKTVTIVINYP